MLSAPRSAQPSLADVMESSYRSLSGESNALALTPVDRAVVFVVDGLGVNGLTERAGHARTLATAMSKRATALSGFPSTTATALATLTTGTQPGQHGMVGYTVLDADNDRVVQLLSGWDDRLDPATWQRMPTIFERAEQAGIPAFAIGIERFRDSGFTTAVLRGARYRSGATLAQRVDATRRVLDGHEKALIYLYAAEVDKASHAHGRNSDRWVRALEEVDAAAATLAASLGPTEGMLVTADHGSLDVRRHNHVLFDREPGLLDGIRHVAGEPRALQLHFEPDASPEHRERIIERWRASEASRAWVATRKEAIAEGWFGTEVHPAVHGRIGDVIVAARAAIAYYDSRTAEPQAMAMIGQHGSLTLEETRVPLLRFGAYARRP